MKKAETRTLRLSDEDAKALAELAAAAGTSESALLQQWVCHGIRKSRIERAAGAYDRGDMDLREAAAYARIPIGVFVDELARRRIPMVRDPGVFERELEDLRSVFGADAPSMVTADPDRSSGPAPPIGPRSRAARRHKTR